MGMSDFNNTEYGLAQQYVNAVMNCKDEDRIYLHQRLCDLHNLDKSETRFLTDNLPIPTDFYAETTMQTINKCASLIVDTFSELERVKKEIYAAKVKHREVMEKILGRDFLRKTGWQNK